MNPTDAKVTSTARQIATVLPAHSIRASTCVDGSTTILMDGAPVRVELRQAVISIGCTSITVEAARYILDQHKKHYPSSPDVVRLQE